MKVHRYSGVKCSLSYILLRYAGRAIVVLFSTLVLLGCSSQQAATQKHYGASDGRHASNKGVANCYDPSNRSEIRLWESSAPGAAGSDPCLDIPFVRVFPASSRRESGRPAIVVIPGGGYDRLSDEKEQTPVAEYFSHNLHVTAFVLYYRLVQPDGTYRYPVPMWDGQRALKLIRYRARQFGVDPAKIGVFGFSAGGHLASTLALHYVSNFNLPVHDAIDAGDGRPAILGLGYPVISMEPAQFAASSSLEHLLYGYRGREREHLQQYLSGQNNVTPHTPPVFLFESMDDQRISPQNSILFAQALHTANIPADIRIFAHGVHGAGLATDIPEERVWPELFHQWLVRQRWDDEF